MDEEVTYFAGSWLEYNAWIKENPGVKSEFIADVSTLESRFPGPIVVDKSVETLWNYQGIMESIARFEKKHEKYYQDREIAKEADELNLDDDDLQFGV